MDRRAKIRPFVRGAIVGPTIAIFAASCGGSSEPPGVDSGREDASANHAVADAARGSDARAEKDASAGRDTGIEPEAGTGRKEGGEPDGARALDSSLEPDATTADTGGEPDTASPSDAGGGSDAASAPDAPLDASSALDATLSQDSGASDASGGPDGGADAEGSFDATPDTSIPDTSTPDAAASCHDGMRDGNETDVDCGGSCSACAVGKGCTIDSDCAPWLCTNAICGLGGGQSALSVGPETLVFSTADTTAAGTSGSPTLSVGSVAGFAVNDIVFIHQTQLAGAGVSEVNRVASLATGTITLTNALAHMYTAGAQVLVLPQYSTVDIAASGALRATRWNGSTGGIVGFLANGAVTIEGILDVSNAGFRGGDAQEACFPGAPGCGLKNGLSGESSIGPSVFSATSTNAAGNGLNNGSGGGGGTAGQDCAAGGGGGYAAAGGLGAAGTIGACTVNEKHGGGFGGATIGTADLTQSMFLGAGGGQGGVDDDGVFPGPGGSGGGIIVIFAASLTVTGRIDADGAPGADGENSTDLCNGRGAGTGSGNGGGGSGGAIRILTSGPAALASQVVAGGGSGSTGGTCGAGYPGGSGGPGRIQVRAGGIVTGVSTPAYVN